MDRQRIFQWIAILVVLGLLPARARIAAAQQVPQEDLVITFSASGFSPASLAIERGQTVIWRNATDAPIRVHNGPALQQRLFLPQVSAVGGSESALPRAEAASSFVLDLEIPAQGEVSQQMGGPAGTFSFSSIDYDVDDSGFEGTLIILPQEGEDPSFAVGYATGPDRTLIRWVWTEESEATFRVYRREAGQPEILLAEVAPILDPADALAVLDGTDARWPDLFAQMQSRFGDQGVGDIPGLHAFLAGDRFLAAQLANQYYPIALVMGLGYLDLSAQAGTLYSYRVEPLVPAGGQPVAPASLTAQAGQITPLAAPQDLVALDLAPATSAYTHPPDDAALSWATVQQNRRFHRTAYLRWAPEDPDALAFPSAWITGYDIHRAPAGDPDALEQVNGIEPVQPMPESVPAAPSADYGLSDHYHQTQHELIPFFYADTTAQADEWVYRVAARDLLGQVRQWPQDADQFSPALPVTTHDFLPPAPPDPFIATVSADQTQVELSWEMVPTDDLAGFRIERTRTLNSDLAPEACLDDADCWLEAAVVDGAARSWTDMDPTQHDRRWYRIQAIDGAGNRSLYAGPVQAILHDTEPPHPPELRTRPCSENQPGFGGTCLDLQGDVETVRLLLSCRFSPDGEELFLDEIEGNVYDSWDFLSVYQPPFDLDGVTCWARAVDLYGNISAPSEEEAVPAILAPQPPQIHAPVITEIETLGDAESGFTARLNWDIVDSPLIQGFRIEREDLLAQPPTLESEIVMGGDIRMMDDPVDATRVYEYRVVALLNGLPEQSSLPRIYSVVDNGERPLRPLEWIQLERLGANQTNLVWAACAGEPNSDTVRRFAIFRSIHAGSDYLQITPIMTFQGPCHYTYLDTSATHGRYWYSVVEFDLHSGEPVAFTQPQQAANNTTPPIDFGSDVAFNWPQGLLHHHVYQPSLGFVSCSAVNPSRHDFRRPLLFGGGFEIHMVPSSILIGQNDDISGVGSLRFSHMGQPVQIDNVAVAGITVANDRNQVCHGQVTVSLVDELGAPLAVAVDGGLRYDVYTIVLGSYFAAEPGAAGEVRVVLPPSLRAVDAAGEEADVLTLAGPALGLDSQLAFTFQAEMASMAGHSCDTPVLTFRLETLPTEVVPLGAFTVSVQRPGSLSISFDQSCMTYRDPYSGAHGPRPLPPTVTGGDSNDGFLRATYTGGKTQITVDGLAGDFATDATLAWVGSYPYAANMAVSGAALQMDQSRIAAGTLGEGSLSLHYRQAIHGPANGALDASFDQLQVDAGGALAGPLATGDLVIWRSFFMSGGGGWDFYAGPVTTPARPASLDSGPQSVMWAPRPGDQVDLGLGSPAQREPGLNRRRADQSIFWTCTAPVVSFSATVDTYLRHGGISQRQRANLEPAMDYNLHGYTSRLEAFDIAYLDNYDWDRHIAGDVDLPFPSDVLLELVAMWLDSDGCIAGGIPVNGQETLAYWLTQILPSSVEFVPFDEDNPTPANAADFPGWDAMLRLFGDLTLPRLTEPNSPDPAVVGVGIDFQPDGEPYGEAVLSPARPDYEFDGFPYLLQGLRLSNLGETATIDADANLAPEPAITPLLQGFLEVEGPLVAPYFGPLGGAGASYPLLSIFVGEDYVGLSQPFQAERTWVDLPPVSVVSRFDNLVYAAGVGATDGRLAGFDSYQFVPGSAVPPLPANAQILHLDSGLVLDPDNLVLLVGQSAGVGVLRALAEHTQASLDTPPPPALLATWADKMAMNDPGDSVDEAAAYADLLAQVWSNYAFADADFAVTTAVLNQYDRQPGQDLPNSSDFGGGSLGALRQRGVTLNRIRGEAETSGSGASFQIERLAMASETDVRRQPSAPPTFYAEMLGFTVNRFGDFILEGENVSGAFMSTDLTFDATLAINVDDLIFEGGVNLNDPVSTHDFEVWNLTLLQAAGVLGVRFAGGADLDYLGLDLEASLNYMPFGSGAMGGQVLFGTIDPDSPVLQNHFSEVLDHLDIVPAAPGDDQSTTLLQGAYIRLYGDRVQEDLSNLLISVNGGVRFGGWYWSEIGGGNHSGAILGTFIHGNFLHVIKARGDVTFIYRRNLGDVELLGEAWVAGGIGSCEPETWTSWSSRWWNDRWCWTAGAAIDLAFDFATFDFSASWEADYE